MVDKHADVWGAMVPPSGVRGTLVKNIAINIWKNLTQSDMKTLAAIILFSLTAMQSQNTAITGYWKTVDDATGEVESIIEIFEKPNGKHYGRISKMIVKPVNDKCDKCRDDRKGKPLLGLEVIRGVAKEKNGQVYGGGTITDPKNGKTYKCTVTRDGDRLHVRGYVGFSLMGRTQTWHLVK